MAKSKDLDSLKAVFQSGEYVKFTLKEAILEYPHLAEPDTAFDSVGKYKVNAIITDDIAEDMTYIGFNVRKNKEDRQYITVVRKPTLGKPKVTLDGTDIDPRSIGNGTVADIDVSARHYKIAGKEHLPVYIEEVKVKDLVSYTPSGAERVEL